MPLYLAMEFIEGETLRKLIERGGRLSISEALAIVIQICDTVRIAHAEGVLHRDLKPENIIIAAKNVGPIPSIVDYGISFNGQNDDLDDLTSNMDL